IIVRPQPTSPLFPYTTLFRSRPRRLTAAVQTGTVTAPSAFPVAVGRFPRAFSCARLVVTCRSFGEFTTNQVRQTRERLNATVVRSEEHTSELQSLRHLVCRLL